VKLVDRQVGPASVVGSKANGDVEQFSEHVLISLGGKHTYEEEKRQLPWSSELLQTQGTLECKTCCDKKLNYSSFYNYLSLVLVL